MSEIVTTNPDMVIALLESQGARCGDGIQPKVLDACPPENFCWLSGEEICVYGHTYDICSAGAGLPLSPASPAGAAVALQPVAMAADLAEPASRDAGSNELSVLVIVLCILIGVALAAKRRDHYYFPPDHHRR